MRLGRLCLAASHEGNNSPLVESSLQENCDMPKPDQKLTRPPEKPKKPGDVQVDIDDAQIEEPKDDVFKKGDKEPEREQKRL
jgi:hypothetical protein